MATRLNTGCASQVSKTDGDVWFPVYTLLDFSRETNPWGHARPVK